MDAYKPTMLERLQRFPIIRNRDFLVGARDGGSTLTEAEAARSMLPQLDVEQVLEGLKAEGLACNIDLPESIVDELIAHAMNNPCCAYANPEHGFMLKDRGKVADAIGRPLLKSDYLNIRSEIPVLKDLVADPKLVELASRYLGFPAVCIRTRLWWAFPGDSDGDGPAASDLSSAAMVFHFDSADFRFVKFFFYLSDVDEDNGPHVFVKGTHTKKKLRHYMSRNEHSDEEMSRAYGQDKIATITGSKGAGFAEDTFGFHKAELPVSGDRLVFMLMFSHGSSSWEDALGDIQMLDLD